MICNIRIVRMADVSTDKLIIQELLESYARPAVFVKFTRGDSPNEFQYEILHSNSYYQADPIFLDWLGKGTADYEFIREKLKAKNPIKINLETFGIIHDKYKSMQIRYLPDDLLLMQYSTDYTNYFEVESVQNKVFNNGPVGLYQCDTKEFWHYEYISENVLELFGYPAKNFITKKMSFENIVFYEDYHRIIQVLEDALNTDKKYIELEPYRILHGNGRVRWIKEFAAIISMGGDIKKIIGYLFDVTETQEYAEKLEISIAESDEKNRELQQKNEINRRTQALLAESENRYRMLFEKMEDAFALFEIVYN